MARVTVGKWGKNLAIRVPYEIAEATGLSEGEQVEIKTQDGDLVIHRPTAHSHANALKALEAMRKDREKQSLGGLKIRDLINEGRR